MTLVDALTDGAARCFELVFVAGDGTRTTVTSDVLWGRAERVAAELTRRGRPGVGLLLEADVDVVAVFLGALRAGCRVVSLPLPSRGQDPERYLTMLADLVADADVNGLVVSDDYRELLVIDGVDVFDPDVLVNAASGRSAPDGGSFVQCSSGSSSSPKGVVLTHDKLLVNAHAALEGAYACGVGPLVSWLPLSHDMGLLGCFLYPWVAAGTRDGWPPTIVLAQPQTFLRNPLSWLDMCAEFHAYYTIAPNFALVRAARFANQRSWAGDLSALENVIVGAEMVKRADLDAFCAALVPHGMSPTAPSPAYGMAEVGLAVAMDRADRPYEVLSVDPVALADGRVVDGPTELIAAGHVLPGVEVAVAGDGVSGELLVSSDSLADRYLHQPISRPHRTGDLGLFSGSGKLVPAGRMDDVLVFQGNNFYAWDIERAASHPELNGGSAVAVLDPDGLLVLVAETKLTGAADRDRVAVELRASVRNRVGVSPARVHWVEPGVLPRTSSGKIQRRRTAALLEH